MSKVKDWIEEFYLFLYTKLSVTFWLVLAQTSLPYLKGQAAFVKHKGII